MVAILSHNFLCSIQPSHPLPYSLSFGLDNASRMLFNAVATAILEMPSAYSRTSLHVPKPRRAALQQGMEIKRNLCELLRHSGSVSCQDS